MVLDKAQSTVIADVKTAPSRRLDNTQMSSVIEILEAAAQILERSAIPEPRRESTSLLSAALRRDKTFLFAHPEYELLDEEKRLFAEMIDRRAAREPFHYITGVKEFYGLDFEVSPSVLIPRPETEMLVAFAIDILSKVRSPTFCEVGTGSGCISVSILANVPAARSVGLEISQQAIEVAERNAAIHSVSSRVEFCISDVFSGLAEKPSFDLIVSNPPYVPLADLAGLQPEVRDHEPGPALTDGGDGLSIIRSLASEAPHHLRPGGSLMFEIGIGQANEVLALFDRSIWAEFRTENDFQNIPRVVFARLSDR